MKLIKICLIMIMFIIMTIGCSQSQDLNISFPGILKICKEKSLGDINNYIQCLDDQKEAAGRLISYLHEKPDISSYRECLHKNTNDQDMTDLVGVSRCLGLGGADNQI